MKVGVIGAGFVGNAMSQLSPGVDIIVWDTDESKRVPVDITFEDFVKQSEIVFIAVPTPMDKDGRCHTDIVESVVSDVRRIDNEQHIVIRSTVPPGTCARLGVSFMPEFLTERYWKTDFIRTTKWIIGTNDNILFELMTTMFKLAKDRGCIDSCVTEQYTPSEAEMMKYTANCFLATKISFFNEVSELCDTIGIDYNNIIKFCGGDPRIGNNHTRVPGHDGKKGYGGTCFPKDMNALAYEFEVNGLESYIIKASIERNEHHDRPERDWKSDSGRAVI